MIVVAALAVLIGLIVIGFRGEFDPKLLLALGALIARTAVSPPKKHLMPVAAFI